MLFTDIEPVSFIVKDNFSFELKRTSFISLNLANTDCAGKVKLAVLR